MQRRIKRGQLVTVLWPKHCKPWVGRFQRRHTTYELDGSGNIYRVTRFTVEAADGTCKCVPEVDVFENQPELNAMYATAADRIRFRGLGIHICYRNPNKQKFLR